ncbi:ArnT family glycosyltransferase [Granulicella arctica]|uniref:ArnT family glycosyltransferase n=1 Tax=Granulicella arctica TaxID=940613 RepID=UPI0021DF56FC|nr:glycosyltransferase family 39 protein [Granulicella arctica]
MHPLTNQRRTLWLHIAAALAIGFALRHWFITHTARIDGDTLIYGEIAINWMQHNVYGFVMNAGVPKPTLIRLPGYPLFLVACFRIFGLSAYTAVMYVQTVIDLVSCLLISALAGRLFGPRARVAALWLAALCPFTASYVAAPLTETLTLACITLAFYALERWSTTDHGPNRWLWVITITLAYSILLRPEQGLLAAAILPAMLWLAIKSRPPHPFAALPRKGGVDNVSLTKRALPVVTAAICILLPLIPWTLRNQRTFHVFQPLAPRYATDPGEKIPLDFQRWYRTWAIDFTSTEDVYWNYDGGPIQITDLPNRAFDSDAQYIRTEALLNDYNDTSNDTPALESRFAELAHERITADPIRYYLALPAARLINMALRPRLEMLPISLEWWKWSEHHAQTAFGTAYAALNLAYFVLAGIGVFLWHRRKWNGRAALAWAMLASITLRCALLLTLDNSEPRYTLEFFPIVFLAASILFSRQKESAPDPSTNLSS